jgi:hypothetical protein
VRPTRERETAKVYKESLIFRAACSSFAFLCALVSPIGGLALHNLPPDQPVRITDLLPGLSVGLALSASFIYLGVRMLRYGIALTGQEVHFRRLLWDKTIPISRIASVKEEKFTDGEGRTSTVFVARDEGGWPLFTIPRSIRHYAELVDEIRSASHRMRVEASLISKGVIPCGPVRVGNRTFAVDSSPLPLREEGKEGLRVREEGLLPAVVQPGVHSLVIRPSAWSCGCFLLLAPLGLLFFGLRLRGLWHEIRSQVRNLCGASRVRFHRGTGLMTFGPLWSRQSRPLSDIVAVQILSHIVPPERIPPPGGHRSPRRRSVKAYQMNLVLDDAYTPRVNVAFNGDQSWTRRAGKQLADFLGVPLVDQTQGTE